MDTHRDYDAPEFLKPLHKDDSPEKVFAALEAKATDMLAKGESQITAGRPDEKEVGSLETPHGFVRQLPDDPLCLRISVGEATRIPGSRYIVLRGQPEACLELLERAVMALRVYKHYAQDPMRKDPK